MTRAMQTQPALSCLVEPLKAPRRPARDPSPSPPSCETMERGAAPRMGSTLWRLIAVLALASTCRGERVHFRIHSGDILDQHTHTRTVLLHPDSEALRHLRQLQQLQQLPAQSVVYYHGAPTPIRASPNQPVSFMRQTMQLPLQPQQAQQQAPPLPQLSPGPPGGPVGGLGASTIQQVPIMPIIPLAPIPGGGQQLNAPGTVLLPSAGRHPALPQPAVPALNPVGAGAPGAPAEPAPARVTTKKTQTSMVTHQMSGPGPWPMHMLLPHGPKGELVPMQLVAVAHARPGHPRHGGKLSAALIAPPSAADLKKGKGCKAFIKPGEDPEVGDCFLEEYENGYNEEHSNKKFFGGGNSKSKTEKGGERNTKRYKNESKFTHNPKLKHQWVRTPDGVHHLVRTEVGPLFTPQQQQPPPPPKKGQRGGRQRSKGSKPNKVTVVRLPPGATAVTTVLRGQQVSQDDTDATSLDEDEEKALQTDDDVEQSLDPGVREEDDTLVEVFKSARSAPIRAPLVAVSPAKPMWVQEYHPVRIKQVEPDEDEFEVEESAPVQVAMSPELAMVRGPHHPAQPRAVDDMDIGWSSGFSDNVFDSGDSDDKADMESETAAADFDHNMDDVGGDDDRHAEQRDDVDDDVDDIRDTEQDHAATEVNGAGHPMLVRKGPAERMLQRSRSGPTSTDHDEDSPRLSAILASGGHVFAPAAPPAPHPAAFGAKDPDRLESGRKAPVVLEFGHELSGYTVTREREQKKWRR